MIVQNKTVDNMCWMRAILYEIGIVLLCIIIPIIAFGQNESLSQNFNKVSLASVYDGDTFRVHLACKYGVFCKTIPIRVRGVDCPEIKGGSAETMVLVHKVGQ